MVHQAQSFDADTFEGREVLRHNWAPLGYEYWATLDEVEYWVHPVTGHQVETSIY